MSTAEPVWRRYILKPIVAQLRQGITPEKIALSIAVGISLAICPVIGTTTILCAIAGILLGLNQPILQLVNYMMYPVQIGLILVFMRMGERIYGAEPIASSLPQLLARFRAAPFSFFQEFAMTFLHCVTAWLIITPLIIAVVYFSCKPLLQAAATRIKP